jgi:hypothetical protein
VVQGSGVVRISLVDTTDDRVVCEGAPDLGLDSDTHVFEATEFQHIPDDVTALVLYMNIDKDPESEGDETTATVLAVEFSM